MNSIPFKKIFLIVICLRFVHGNAQTLNEFGHITNVPDSAVIPEAVLNLAAYGQLNENTILKVFDGYAVFKNHCDGYHTEFIATDLSGEVRFRFHFPLIASIGYSTNRKFALINTSKNLVRLNLQDGSQKIFPHASVFGISDEGKIVLAENEIAYDEGNSFSAGSTICKILFFREEPVIITDDRIFHLHNGNLRNKFSDPSGRIFDAKVINANFIFSTRHRSGSRFIYQKYESSDLEHFCPRESTTLDLKGNQRVKRDASSSISSSFETIFCPLDLLSDTVYQPVGNSYGEIQDYGSGHSYLHPGVDLMGHLFQAVYSVRKGYVKAILTTSGSAHWRIAIANENTAGQSTGYLYAHVDELSIPYAVGDSVEEGDLLGQIVFFPQTGFDHCHFARLMDSGIVWSGSWYTYEDPLASMENFYDSVPPVFELTDGNFNFAFRDSSGTAIYSDSLYGKIKIISKFFDYINSSWKVDVHSIRYVLATLAGQTLIDTPSCMFDFYTDEYFLGPYTPLVLSTIYCRDSAFFSVGNYSDREFYHIITNSDGNDTIDENDSLQYFDTRFFPDNDYVLKVIATDAAGNAATDSMIVRFRNLNSGVAARPDNSALYIGPNPAFEESVTLHFRQPKEKFNVEVVNETGKVVFRRMNCGPENSLQLWLPERGVYIVRVFGKNVNAVRKVVRM